MKIKFGDVQAGEQFITHYSKRRLTAIKVAQTQIASGQICNAVILLGHTDQPAEDIGAMIFEGDDLEVEVKR
jgi:hypothetical protein